jgi:hypothetical protein
MGDSDMEGMKLMRPIPMPRHATSRQQLDHGLLMDDALHAACGLCCVCGCADYGFEYSDEEPEEEDVDIENQYYNSKGTPFAPCCVCWVPPVRCVPVSCRRQRALGYTVHRF